MNEEKLVSISNWMYGEVITSSRTHFFFFSFLLFSSLFSRIQSVVWWRFFLVVRFHFTMFTVISILLVAVIFSLWLLDETEKCEKKISKKWIIFLWLTRMMHLQNKKMTAKKQKGVFFWIMMCFVRIYSVWTVSLWFLRN